ncbi:MAG: glycosyltransferase family 61 protein [Tunicatimonas sp.]
MISQIRAIHQNISRYFFTVQRAEQFYYRYQADSVSKDFIVNPSLPPYVQQQFATCISHYRLGTYLEEYVVRYQQPCLIEPQQGWAINPDDTLVYESIGSQSWEMAPLPSYLKYKLPNKAKEFDTVISLNMIRSGWSNYWHFMHDILGQLLLLKECGLANYPIVIPQGLAEKQFFIDAVRRSNFLSTRQWISQNGFYVKAQRALFAQRMPHAKAHFDTLYQTLEAEKEDRSGADKIFLTRRPPRGRTLRNYKAIEEVARSYGFAVVDTDEMNLDEQIALFAGASHVVGIHGAGLLNILFRQPAPLHLLEIFPRSYVQIHYYWLCQHYGFAYDAVVGEDGDSLGEFTLNPERFSQKLDQMLSG